MSITPSAGIDPRWYFKSKTLNADAATDFPSLVRRIQLFNRDSMILMISVCSWFAGSLPPDDPRIKENLNYILKRYSPFIGTLALIFCDKDGGKAADEVDLRILTGELFNIGGMEPNSNWYINHEIIPLQKRLNELAQENHYLKKINPTDIKILSSLLLMSRITLVQWEGISFSSNDWIRTVLLYEKYREEAIKRGFCSINELERAEKQFIGTSYSRLMKCTLMLITLFKASITDPKNPPGGLDPKEFNFPEELASTFDLEKDDIGIVASRFAINASDPSLKRKTLEQIPPKAWLCSKELWSLHDHPLVRIDDKDPRRLILSALQERLLPKCAKILQHEIVKFYEENDVFKAKQRAYDLKGVALEEYVLERAKDTGLSKIDPLLPKNYLGKRPDFLWAGNEWTILVEVKSNIKMNSDPTFFNSASLVDSWNTLTEPLEQGREFLKTGIIKTKKCCLVIVTNDNLCEPMTNFKRVAKQWDFLLDSGIDSIALLSLSQLEAALAHHSPDSVGKNIQNTWDALEPLSVNAKLLDYDFFDDDQSKKASFEHIAEKWNELFPNVKMYTRLDEK